MLWRMLVRSFVCIAAWEDGVVATRHDKARKRSSAMLAALGRNLKAEVSVMSGFACNGFLNDLVFF